MTPIYPQPDPEQNRARFVRQSLLTYLRAQRNFHYRQRQRARAAHDTGKWSSAQAMEAAYLEVWLDVELIELDSVQPVQAFCQQALEAVDQLNGSLDRDDPNRGQVRKGLRELKDWLTETAA